MCGLCKKSGGSPIPLRSVRVESTVIGYTARVVSRLEYENEEGNPVEAVFTFPLDESSTVVDFTALIDDRKIVGIIKEKEEAKQAYDDGNRKRSIGFSYGIGPSRHFHGERRKSSTEEESDGRDNVHNGIADRTRRVEKIFIKSMI